MIKITSEIIKVIEEYQTNTGKSTIELASLIDTTPGTVDKWKNGTTKQIRKGSWLKLKPLIQPYLPKETANDSLDIDSFIVLSREIAEKYNLTISITVNKG